MLNCRSCGAVLQPGWKACPWCGNKVQGEQGASFNITDSVAKIEQTDESKTVGRSVHISDNVVSSAVTIGETVNVSNVVNVGSINEQPVSQDEWKSFVQKMNTVLESEGLQSTTPSGEPLTTKQSELAAEVREKVEAAGQQFGTSVGDPEIHMRLGNAAVGSGDHEQAIESYNQAIKLDPQNSTAYNNRAAAYNHLGQQERAIQDVSESIRLDPHDSTTHSNRGAMYHALRQYERAVEDYGESIRLDPQNANTYAFRALAYAALEQAEESVQDYSEAIRIVPNIITTPKIIFDLIYVAKAYQGLRQIEQAKKIIDIYITRVPKDEKGYLARASIYQNMDQPENAVRDLEEAFRIDPQLANDEHAIAWYNTFKGSAAAASALSEPQWSERPSNDVLKIANCTADDVIIWVEASNRGWADLYLVLTKDELLWIEKGSLGSKSRRHAVNHSAIVSIQREKGLFVDNVVIHSGDALPNKKFEYIRFAHRKNMDILLKILGFHEDER